MTTDNYLSEGALRTFARIQKLLLIAAEHIVIGRNVSVASVSIEGEGDDVNIHYSDYCMGWNNEETETFPLSMFCDIDPTHSGDLAILRGRAERHRLLEQARRAEEMQQAEKKAKQAAEAVERAEYERLRMKFEGVQ